MQSPNQGRQVLSVSQLNQDVRLLLENSIGTVWLAGELSNLSMPFSGHWYFTLKDDKAQVRCAMFKGSNRRVLFKPENGQQLLVRARISVYEPRGEYQLIVDSMQPEGDGAMQLAFDQLKMKLAGEGLFAEQRKRPLPKVVQRIGLITSASGAALHDVLTVLQRRAPALQVVIYPSQVQGVDAPASLVAMLETANIRQEVDVLLLTRGGGSKEDLWCFNDEELARAIALSELPVISAVGHEVDTSISDFVADLRAATPSAAAEILSQGASEIRGQLQLQQQRLVRSFAALLERQQQRYTHLQARLNAQAPTQRLEQNQQRLDELSIRLEQALMRKLEQAKSRQKQYQQRLSALPLSANISKSSNQVEQLSQRLQQAINVQQEQAQQQLASLCKQLDALSPLQVLHRGYSFVTKDQQVVNSVEQLESGDKVDINLADGSCKAQVI